MRQWVSALLVCVLLVAGCTSPPPPDMDEDGIIDSEDNDVDGDGYNNTVELDCLSDAWNSSSTPSDIDGDGFCDALDPDMDGDGLPNEWEEER